MALNRIEILATQKNRYTYCPNFSGYVTAIDLWPGSGQIVAVPASADLVYFTCVDSGANPAGFWCNIASSASIPVSGGISNGTASIANPGGRSVSGVSTLGFISPVACKVICEWYRIAE